MIRHEQLDKSTERKAPTIGERMKHGALVLGTFALAGATYFSVKGAIDQYDSASRQRDAAYTALCNLNGAQLGAILDYGPQTNLFGSEAVPAESDPAAFTPEELGIPPTTEDPIREYENAMEAADETELKGALLGFLGAASLLGSASLFGATAANHRSLQQS